MSNSRLVIYAVVSVLVLAIPFSYVLASFFGEPVRANHETNQITDKPLNTYTQDKPINNKEPVQSNREPDMNKGKNDNGKAKADSIQQQPVQQSTEIKTDKIITPTTAPPPMGEGTGNKENGTIIYPYHSDNCSWWGQMSPDYHPEYKWYKGNGSNMHTEK